MTLLEREEEIDALASAIDGARSGRGRCVLIEGPAGAGKTALLEHASRETGDHRMLALRARGGELERDFPFGVIRQLFEAQVVADREDRLLTGAAALAAPVFDAAETDAPAAGATTLHGLYWLAADVAARQPVLLLIDDLQWADQASLQALLYIARRLDGVRLIIVATVRTGETGHAHEVLGALRREPGVVRLSPGPLSPAGAAAIGRRALGDDAQPLFLEACGRASGGNPFLLVELLRALVAQEVLPVDVNASEVTRTAAAGAARSIMLRLERLGDDAIAVARAVAVLEPDALPEHIAALSELPAGRVTAECERLVGAQLLTNATPQAFVHPLVKEAVYRDTAAPRLAAMHLAAARTLHARGAESASVAVHLLRCPPAQTGWVTRELRQAAQAARGRGAPQAAADYLRRALAEPPPADDAPEIRRELGTALLDGGDARGLDELLTVRAASGDPMVRAQIAMRVGASLAIRDRAPEGVDLLSDALREIGDSDPGFLAHLRAQRYFGLARTGTQLDRAELLRDCERASAKTLGERQLLSTAALWLASGFGRCAEARSAAERLVRDPGTLIDDAQAGWMRSHVVAPAVTDGRGIQASIDILDAQESVARRRGASTDVAFTIAYRSYAHLLSGALSEADADASTATRLIAELGMGATWPMGAPALMIVRAERGDLAEATALLAADPPADELPYSSVHAHLCLARARLQQALGDHVAARVELLAAGERLKTVPFPSAILQGWRERLALSEFALGDVERARALAADAARIAWDAGYAHGIAATLRIRGMVTGADGIDLLREATDAVAATDARLEHAHCLVEMGAALRRASHRREAREPLRAGLDLAHRCGARALELRASTELAATGARPRTAVLTGVDSLTPSELRVARLAATGLTNREIAQRLFVTTKTVETQLRASYRKLDIAGRGQLGAALA